VKEEEPLSFLRSDASRDELRYAARSLPVRIRFKETRPWTWEWNPEVRLVSAYYCDRELCFQFLEAKDRQRLYALTVFNDPVPLLMLGQFDDTGLEGWLYAEIESPEPYEIPAVRIPLGLRSRSWSDMRYPDDPVRETRDLLLEFLLGDPEEEIEGLVRSVAWMDAEREV